MAYSSGLIIGPIHSNYRFRRQCRWPTPCDQNFVGTRFLYSSTIKRPMHKRRLRLDSTYSKDEYTTSHDVLIIDITRSITDQSSTLSKFRASKSRTCCVLYLHIHAYYKQTWITVGFGVLKWSNYCLPRHPNCRYNLHYNTADGVLIIHSSHWGRISKSGHRFQMSIANIFICYCRFKAAHWQRTESGILALHSTLASRDLKSLSRLSILRPFNPQHLRSPLPKELQAELQWQEQLAEKTKNLYI